MVFGLTEEQDNFFTTQFGLIFIIVFLHFTFSNGYATLVFLENEYPDYLMGELYPDSVVNLSNDSFNVSALRSFTPSDYEFIIQDYRRQVGYRQVWIPKVMLIFYIILHLHALMIFTLKPKSI